ncbi:SPFH domain-containing protein [Halothermothrix orenii]|uniref:Band 7 protein n=1 Tax=Halothermothrix orenii (strain H 168 / OCM 544 / DSM 9562) TaxID=373903 RepID=B8CY44_HALOH|nr:SPFH domain-containing protein [Halothermothrix orenii]ACL70213.1 band 7 protein [Halothermothrix orenii H 168]
MALLVILGVIALFVIILIVKGIVIIPQAETMVIERLGRFNRVLDSGVNVIIPIIERPQTIDWKYIDEDRKGNKIVLRRKISRIDLRETVYDFPKQNVITKDNVAIEINAMLYFQITDPKKAVYEINNLPNAIEKLTQTTLRNVIGELELDETLASRDKINSKLKSILDEATDKWGVKVNRVELQDIAPPEDIKEAMEKQMRAERDKRAAILKAEGKKKSAILEAEGKKEAEINEAEGKKMARILEAEGEQEARIKVAQAEAKAIKTIAASVKDAGGDPTQYLIAIRYIETLREMVEGKDNKVIYLPYEATGILGSVGSIKELFQEG